MSDQHKPLTTAEIEELMERIETALALHHEGGPLAETPLKIPAGAYRALVDAKRLLSLLTPPTDAELREAVERHEQMLELLHTGNEAWIADCRLILRAVQAPRLTGEQVKEAYLNGYEDGNEDGRALTGCRNVYEHTPRYDPDTAWAKSDTRAVFSEVYEKEG